MVSGVYRRYSGHTSDGKVYLEGSGTTDAATGSNISMSVATPKVRSDLRSFALMKASLLHSDWGVGKTCTMTTQVGRDTNQNTQSRTDAVALSGERFTEQAILRAGDWLKIQIDQSDSGQGALAGLELEIADQSGVGTTTRVA
jgi:hypothetical protein